MTPPETKFRPTIVRVSLCAAVELHRTSLSATAPTVRSDFRLPRPSIRKALNHNLNSLSALSDSERENASIVKSRKKLLAALLLALSLVSTSGRSAARVVSASAARTKKIRVMTYNIHVGVGM